MKMFDIIKEGAIDYNKPGPVTQSSLGQKLEYGIPVNDKGQFYNPNKIPNYDQLTDAEYSAMLTAYKTWLSDYLTRWPEATQQPDGTWRGLKPGLAAPKMFEMLNAQAQEGVAEGAKKGLYYNVNKRKKAGTSRDASSPKAPTAQAWKDAAKTAKKEGVSEMRDRRDSVQRDYDSSIAGMDGSDKREFKRREMEHELGHETNNIAIAINGKTWKVVRGKGTADSREEKEYLNNMKKWAEKKSASSGKKWTVHLTGAEPTNESLNEFASAPGNMTTAANVGVGAIYKNKPVSQPKNKDGTAKNALDMKGANLLRGGSVKR